MLSKGRERLLTHGASQLLRHPCEKSPLLGSSSVCDSTGEKAKQVGESIHQIFWLRTSYGFWSKEDQHLALSMEWNQNKMECNLIKVSNHQVQLVVCITNETDQIHTRMNPITNMYAISRTSMTYLANDKKKNQQRKVSHNKNH